MSLYIIPVCQVKRTLGVEFEDMIIVMPIELAYGSLHINMNQTWRLFS